MDSTGRTIQRGAKAGHRLAALHTSNAFGLLDTPPCQTADVTWLPLATSLGWLGDGLQIAPQSIEDVVQQQLAGE
jgi:hypothetical protein